MDELQKARLEKAIAQAKARLAEWEGQNPQDSPLRAQWIDFWKNALAAFQHIQNGT